MLLDGPSWDYSSGTVSEDMLACIRFVSCKSIWVGIGYIGLYSLMLCNCVGIGYVGLYSLMLCNCAMAHTLLLLLVQS